MVCGNILAKLLYIRGYLIFLIFFLKILKNKGGSIGEFKFIELGFLFIGFKEVIFIILSIEISKAFFSLKLILLLL